MKLTIDELQPLVSSPEDILKHLTILQRVEALDLSNGGIIGEQITELLRFISLSPSPVTLRSVDIGHNRLGDTGTIALARLLQENASKLFNLESLDLFENDIRDEGALALVSAIQEEAEKGHLPLLTSITLHDNDISETVLCAADATWREIAMTRALGWKHPAESALLGFGELLKREVEGIKARHIAAVAERLEPLSIFLKRALWHRVTREGKTGGRLVLRLFAAPADKSDKCSLIGLDTNIINVYNKREGCVRDWIARSPGIHETG